VIKKLFIFFIGVIVFTASLNAQTIEIAIIGASAKISRELPSGASVAIINFNSDSESLNEYTLNELYGAILRSRKVTPIIPNSSQFQTIRNNLNTAGRIPKESAQSIGKLLGVQYLITGSLEQNGAFCNITFIASDLNAEIKSEYQASINPRNDSQLASFLKTKSQSQSKPSGASSSSSTTTTTKPEPSTKAVITDGTQTDKTQTKETVTASGASSASGNGKYIILETVEFVINTGSGSIITFNINKEDIEGREKEVLNINGTLATNSYSELYTLDKTIIEKIIKGSGVSFKALGDGKTWSFGLIFKGTYYYHYSIKTKKNTIVEVDIPYSKLKQPSWSKKAKFNKDDIERFSFYMGDAFNITQPGKYDIKIFDFEIY